MSVLVHLCNVLIYLFLITFVLILIYHLLLLYSAFYRQDMLPAIVFTNSRDSVDSILTEVL
jgi:hypothetical protein